MAAVPVSAACLTWCADRCDLCLYPCWLAGCFRLHAVIVNTTSACTQDTALEFRGGDFDWKHTGWQHSAANRSLSAAATRSLNADDKPRRAKSSFPLPRWKTRAVVNADSPPESPSEPLLKGLRFSVRRGELLGICGEVSTGEYAIAAFQIPDAHCMKRPLPTALMRLSHVPIDAAPGAGLQLDCTKKYLVTRRLERCRWVQARAPSWPRCLANSSHLSAALAAGLMRKTSVALGQLCMGALHTAVKSRGLSRAQSG